jgi:branched-chain amino acid transport system substrate-binding protein
MRVLRLLSTKALSVIGLAALATAVHAAEPVRIGYSMSRTGIFAQAAPSQVNAYDLWKEQVNAKGGIGVGGVKRMVEFVGYDDQSNPANAVRIYEKLITQDKVDLLIAPWGTPMHMAVAPVLTRYKFPMVGNTAASVKLREVNPGYIWFPASEIPDRFGAELAAFMKAQGVTKAAIIASELPFGQEIKQYLVPALKNAGIALAVNENYPPDIKDLTPLLASISKAKPDAIIALSYPGDSFLFATQARELGLSAPFVFSLVGPTFSAYLNAFGNAVDGIVTLGAWSPNQAKWPSARPFFDAYVKRFKEIPDASDSVLAYSSLEILQAAVAKAGLDKEKLRAAISTGTFDTINGPVKFKGVENTITPTAFLQIQKGALEIVWPASIKTADFHPKQGW